MATKREKAHYECKQLSCGDVMLSEQQQNHTTKAAKAKPAERTWVWDSHSNTVDSEAAARAARANVSVEDQIAQIHRQKVSKKDLFTFAPRIHILVWLIDIHSLIQ